MERLPFRISLRGRLLLILLIPLVGMTVFAAMWAGQRLTNARDAEAASRRTTLVVESTRLLYEVDLVRTISELLRDYGGFESLGPLEDFANAQVGAANSRVGDISERLAQLAAPRDRETLASVDAAVAQLQLANDLLAERPSAGSLRIDRTEAYAQAAAAIDRAALELGDQAATDRRSQTGSLLGLVELQRLVLREGVLTLVNALRPSRKNLEAQQLASATAAAAERLVIRQLPPGARQDLASWDTQRGEQWRRFQTQALAGERPAPFLGIQPLWERITTIERAQKNLAANVTSAAIAGARSARHQSQIAIAVASALLLLSVLFTVVTLRPATRTLRRIEQRARQIGAGELDGEPLITGGRDETALLATSFNHMTETLRTLQEQIDALADGRSDDPVFERAVPGRLGESMSRSIDRLTAMTSRLRTSEEMARLTIDTAVEAIWTLDRDGRLVEMNTASRDLIGGDAPSLVGRSLVDLTGLTLDDDDVTDTEMRLRRADGSPVDVLVSTRSVIAQDGAHHRMVFARDISERKRMEARLEWEATHDPLTGLPNRAALHREIAHSMDRRSAPIALLFIDLDRFKRVNDALGHRMGDELLRQVVSRIRANVRTGDFVSRLGGDEFVVIHRGQEMESTALAARLIQAIEEPYLLDGTPAHVSASVGIALNDRVNDATELIRRADMAMYRAKNSGRGSVVEYDTWMQEWAHGRVELEQALRIALRDSELHANFQPIVDLADGTIKSVELLARWMRPGVGLVPPDDFIPIAEETGLVVDIGRWALREAAYAARELRTACSGFDAPIAVNISGRHLAHGELQSDVEEVLREYDIPAEWLRLEITESYLLDDTLQGVDQVLRGLVDLGVRMSIDDFGTGYSSLTYLRRVPADEVKIDRSYIAGLHEDHDALAIVELVSALSHALGFQVVAEGVETEAQRDLLKAAGCDQAQGYLFSPPLPRDEILRWVTHHVTLPVPA